MYKFETLTVVKDEKTHVAHVMLSRDKLNAMNQTFWRECRECFTQLNQDKDVRCIVISSKGKVFTAGLDLTDGMLKSEEEDFARRAFSVRQEIMLMQDSFTAIENCKQPVIAAVHSACIGGGVDLICACDFRYCTKDAYFTIKEVDVGLAADVGTLQRMPKIVGNEGLVRELAYTARKFPAQEALEAGFINRIFDTQELLIEGALKVAAEIAAKSPVAIYGTKRFLNHARDHTIAEGLEYAALWNISMLNTEDLALSFQASMQKKTATFSKL